MALVPDCDITSSVYHDRFLQRIVNKADIDSSASLCTPRLTDLSSYCHSYALHLRAVVTHTCICALRNHSIITMTLFSNHASAKELLIHNLKHHV